MTEAETFPVPTLESARKGWGQFMNQTPSENHPVLNASACVKPFQGFLFVLESLNFAHEKVAHA